MRYAFFGTTEFSLLVLRELLSSPLPPALIVCNPDRPLGRKRILTSPAVKNAAEAAGIPVLQPEKIDDEFISAFRKENFDFSLLAAYGKILPSALIEASGRGIIGVHVSLLPKYRGASPMQSAILAGEEKSGISLYLMDEKVDHGPVLADVEVPVGRRNFSELQAESALAAARLLLRILPDFASGKLGSHPQDESAATFTKKFRTEDAFVDPADLEAAENGDGEKAARIDRMIRALNPEPGTWTIRQGKRLKLLRADLNGDRLVLRTVQWEGKTPQDI